MQKLNPEQVARQQIDSQLIACGWIVQDYKAIDFSAGRGIAVREVPLKTGPCDYLLLVDRKALGVVEAKKVGTTLSTVSDQSARYASSLPDLLAAGATGPLPFLYESTGVETFFRDSRDHIATSLSIEADDFDYSPFSQQGGLGKAYQLFGDQLPTLLEELNGVLVV